MARSTSPSKLQELFESERRFRLLVEGVVDYAIFMLDLNGVITNWNAGAERIHGYRANEIVGLNFSQFYTAEERDAGLPERALATARDEGKYATEGWRLRKDGTRFFASVVIDPIYDAGELVGYAKITRDVSERESAATALRESDRQFQLLVGNVTDYALYMLDPEGRVSSWNAGGERIKGYSPEEIIGQNFSRFYTEADRAAGRPARALAIARDTGRYEEDGWRVRKDGSYFWASVVIDPIRLDGRLLGYAKITRDITERRDAQVAMERVQQQLAESQKMDALGQLTGGVAHDFNNLLMVVSGHIQTLKKITGGDARAARAAQAIEHAAERGATLTRQLLTFARRARVNPQPIDVRQRIDAIREVLISGLGRNIRFVVDVAADIWPVTVDVGEFEIALVNLVINARDAMPEGGTVTITAKNQLFGANKPAPPGEYVVLGVKDTGVGIPDDILVRVFEPFFTTKEVGKGTGLGLSQVHGFVHQAGGAVKIDSTLGQGTMLKLYLPRAADGAVSVEGGEPAKETLSAGAVLLVEDNPDVASASAGLLEQLGYEVKWVSSAEAALEAIEANGFNLVFSDIVMPGRLDGLGLAKIVRERYPALPVLLATGYSEAVQSADSQFPILRKPYRLNELSQALTRLTHA